MILLASGRYRYWRDTEPQPVTEPWSLRCNGRALMLHSQRWVDQRRVLEVTALFDGLYCRSFTVNWNGAASDNALRARYSLRDSCSPHNPCSSHNPDSPAPVSTSAPVSVHVPGPALNSDKNRSRDIAQLDWQRDPGDGWGPRQSLEIPRGTLLFPLMRAAAGPLVQLLAQAERAEAEQPRCVVLPWLRDPTSQHRLLEPLLSERSVVAFPLAQPPMTASPYANPPGPDRHYRYYGGEYGQQGADYWLNGYGLLQRYRWSGTHGDWDIQLDQLWTASGFSGFDREPGR